MKIRDRIKELRRVSAFDLMVNASNWRKHPGAQRSALIDVLGKIGIANAVLVYESARNEGALTIVDGHLRQEVLASPETLIPVLVLDVNDAEADALVATLDRVAEMAETDVAALKGLIQEIQQGDESLGQMVDRMWAGGMKELRIAGHSYEPTFPIVKEFHEHYDYVLFLAQTEDEWQWLSEFFGVEKRQHKDNFGVGRVMTVPELQEWWRGRVADRDSKS